MKVTMYRFLPLFILLLLSLAGNVVSQKIVRSLPGLHAPLPSELETGYVNVDDTDGVELFYYFFKSEVNPVQDPLIFWFTGGPGCSGLSAILFENGPLKIRIAEYNGSIPTLYSNPYSWTKVSNMLYIDAPVGTGYSYSRSSDGSVSNDIVSAKQRHIFIRKWLTDHPQFLPNPMYVAGDSYSGQVVPVVVQDILDGIERGEKPIINLKGYVLGNPITYRYQERNFAIPFAHGMGILSDELFESLKKNCGGEYVEVDPENIECNEALQLYRKCVDGLDHSNILSPLCSKIVPEPKFSSIFHSPSPDPEWPCDAERGNRGTRSLGEYSSVNNKVVPPPFPGFECQNSYGYVLSFYWANDGEVRKALNIRKGKSRRWLRCNQCGINYLHSVVNSIGYHSNISKRQLRSLIYNGDHDLGVTFLSTQAWIRSLNYSISDEWRPWLVDNQIAGYTRTYTNNMTFATLKGAGHLALEYTPKECLAMIKRWLSHDAL